jgi:hypothetical protein
MTAILTPEERVQAAMVIADRSLEEIAATFREEQEKRDTERAERLARFNALITAKHPEDYMPLTDDERAGYEVYRKEFPDMRANYGMPAELRAVTAFHDLLAKLFG